MNIIDDNDDKEDDDVRIYLLIQSVGVMMLYDHYMT
jgi:hypothetical protein